MKTRRLLGSIKCGIAVCAVAFPLQARADAPGTPPLRLATGQFVTPTAYRTTLKGMISAPVTLLWNVEKAP